MSDTLYTVMETADTPSLVEKMIRVWFPDVKTILDATYGHGGFWRGSERSITSVDINTDLRPDVVADFQRLPFARGSFDLVVFDPPYHTDMGKKKSSVMGARFGTYKTLADLQNAVMIGCAEARSIARVGILVKVQDYCHASRIQWMDDWVRLVLGEPYDRVIQSRKHKIVDPKWGDQLTAYRNHAVWLAYRKDTNVHKRRL